MKCIALGLAIGLAFATPLHAQEAPQQKCGPRVALLEKMKQNDITPAGIGVTADGTALVSIVTDANGEWALVVFGTDGSACVVESGSGWTIPLKGKVS